MAQPHSIPKEILIATSAAEQVKARNDAAIAQQASVTEDQQRTVAALGVLQAAGGLGAGTQSDLQAQVLQALLENLQHDMAKKRAKEAEDENNLLRLMLARADSIKHEKAQRENTQRVCDHRKENGHSRICGQKVSNGHVALLCNLCYREFDENNCPPHLMVSNEFIGG